MSDVPPPSEPFDIPVARPASTEIPVARPLGLPPVPEKPVAAWLLPTSTGGSALVDIFALFGCLMAFEMLLGIALVVFVGDTAGTDGDMGLPGPEALRGILLPILGIRATAATALVLLVLRCRRQSLATIGVVWRSWGLNLGIGGCSTVVAYLLIMMTMALIWLVSPELIEQAENNAGRLLELIPRLSPLGFVAMSVIVGVYEELLFRGFLMTRLRRATHSWTVAVLISTAIFTALHAMDQEAIALVAVAILSLVFSVVTIWRRSIIPAIVGHALFDLSQLIGLMWQAGDTWT